MAGSQLYFTNINAQVYGGTCTGQSYFTLNGGADRPYRAEIVAEDVGMTELARFYGETGAKKHLGKLTGHASLQGDVGQPIGKNISGNGFARIEDGWLVELPVLKAFTQVARVVFSQFSMFSQTDFSMDFNVHDGAVHTENLVLEGDLMTLKGQGRYDFTAGFDAGVEMKPFRKNKFTRVVQWASTPFSELLKFNVQGPLSDPTWRLAVTSMFKGKNGESAPEE